MVSGGLDRIESVSLRDHVEGDDIWFGEAVKITGSSGGYSSSTIVKIDPSLTPLAIIEETAIQKDPTTGQTRLPLELVAGPDGNIWFTDNATTAIVAFNPSAKTFSPFAVPKESTYSTIPYGITAGLGNIWFTDNVGGAVDVGHPGHQAGDHGCSPTTVTTGGPFDLTAKVEYSDTNAVDTAYNGNVSIALTNPASNTLGGTTTVPVTAGVATFTADPGQSWHWLHAHGDGRQPDLRSQHRHQCDVPASPGNPVAGLFPADDRRFRWQPVQPGHSP